MSLNKKVGIIGGGNLGNKTWDLLARNNQVIVYDIVPCKCSPIGILFNDILECDIVIICISLNISNGEIDTDILIDLIGRLHRNNIKNIIIRSKVPPGTSDSLNSYYFPNLSDNLIMGVPKEINDISFKNWIDTEFDSN